MADTLRPIKRALLSVSDKNNLVDLAKQLHDNGVKLLSTGGTSKLLKDNGLPVTDVSDVTGFPEIMNGRVKTLHPHVHGGLLAMRDNPEHQAAQNEHGIENIDLLVVNLYPFEETVARGASFEETIENIDIGGPAMIRAAAKNHDGVTTIVDSDDYAALIAELTEHKGAVSAGFRKKMAAKAFSRTANYDTAISNWFMDELGETEPKWKSFSGTLSSSLRYGENPHQSAAYYSSGTKRPGIATAKLIQGKALSYNNLNDTDAAFELVSEFDPALSPAVAIIKHANPCGVARADSLTEAYRLALRTDPVSAFGGIIALNQPLDEATAQEIVKIFTEVIIAPDASDEAKAIIATKKNLRLMLTGGLADPKTPSLYPKALASGFLVQGRDNKTVDKLELNVVTKRAPNDKELADLKFAFQVAKHVKSNAIIYAKDLVAVGIGAGQMSRIDSTRIAASKAKDAADTAGLPDSLTQGSVVASDAFFPFADGLLAAAEAGATAIIQPGGSIRDDDVIAAADEKDLAMVFTGVRHFRH